MKKTLVILIFFGYINSYSQQFVSSKFNVSIPDFEPKKSTSLIIDILVENLPTKIDSTFGFEKIQLAIRHPYISDIKVTLQSPDGTEVWITNRNGKDGKNYTETTFSQHGFAGPINQGKPPFLGNYLPEGFLTHFNNGQNPNGIWKMYIFDLKKEDVGIFDSAVIFFGNKPAKTKWSNCSISMPQYCRCADGSTKGILLPDLAINPVFTLENWEEYKAQNGQPACIRFGVATTNIGVGPLEIVSSEEWYCGRERVRNGKTKCKDGSYPKTMMYQHIYELNNSKLTINRKQAGTLYYDNRPGHEHFHADDFVIYKLLKPLEGKSNPEEWELIGKGTKASFCIWNLDYCREEYPNCFDINKKRYEPALLVNYGLGNKYTGCNEKLQGLSVGGIDSYGQNYEGQSIDLPPNTTNGLYYLYLEVDAFNHYTESNKLNNKVLIPIKLTKQKN